MSSVFWCIFMSLSLLWKEYCAILQLTLQWTQTVKAALKDLHISLCFPDLRDQSLLPLPRRMSSGIQRVHVCRNKTKKLVHLLITPSLLSQLHTFWESTGHPDRLVLWTVAVLCFAGFFCSGDLLQTQDSQHMLSWGDVSLDSRDDPSVVHVHWRFYKCDQYGRCVTSLVNQPLLCLFSFFLRWRRVWGLMSRFRVQPRNVRCIQSDSRTLVIT